MPATTFSSSISRSDLLVLSVEMRANLWLVLFSAPVVQLDRATASGAVGCGFEPRRAQLQLAPLETILLGKIRENYALNRFRMFAHQNARPIRLFAK